MGIGDGSIGESDDTNINIDIPDDLLIKPVGDPIESIVESTYPDLLSNMCNDSYFQERSILTPKNLVVDEINNYMLLLVPGEERTYLSFDSPLSKNPGVVDDVHTPEFLNTITSSGLPNHMIKLKVGVPVMLLRNLDQSACLCNGTRLLITKMGRYVLEGKVIPGSNIGDKVSIPRLSLSPSDTRLPCKFQRRQFSLTVSFAMTINKSQGQSLKHVGIYITRSVFSHDQLYVALSRVTSRDGLKFLLGDDEGVNPNTTTNVVYKEVFHNL